MKKQKLFNLLTLLFLFSCAPFLSCTPHEGNGSETNAGVASGEVIKLRGYYSVEKDGQIYFIIMALRDRVIPLGLSEEDYVRLRVPSHFSFLIAGNQSVSMKIFDKDENLLTIQRSEFPGEHRFFDNFLRLSNDYRSWYNSFMVRFSDPYEDIRTLGSEIEFDKDKYVLSFNGFRSRGSGFIDCKFEVVCRDAKLITKDEREYLGWVRCFCDPNDKAKKILGMP